MVARSVRLSIEELAFAMGVLGGVETASGILQAVLGQREKAELDGRLYAAGHSLMARGLLTVDVPAQSKELDSALGRMVEVMLASDFTLRYSRATHGQEEVLNHFFRQGRIVSERVIQDVVCELAVLGSADEALEEGRLFFGLPAGGRATGATESAGIIAADLLDQIRQETSKSSIGQLAQRLQEAGLAAQPARMVAEDLLVPEYHGAVLRVDNVSGNPVSERGFLILKGQRRFWLLELKQQEPAVLEVWPDSGPRYRAAFERLLR